MNTKGTARLQASGNQETISARVRVPNAKYQAEIDIRKALPLLTSTNLVLGSGSFKVSPFSGHYAQIRLDHLDLTNGLIGCLLLSMPLMFQGCQKFHYLKKWI